MEDYSFFVMTNCRGFHWNLRFVISFLECLICYLLFVVVLFSAFFSWSWTLANDWISATVIQAFQRFSFLCKWVWKTSKFFVMTDYSVFQWGLLRFMILFLGFWYCIYCLLFFVSWCFLFWTSAHDRVSATVIKSF